MSEESTSTSKNPPSTNTNEKSSNCLTFFSLSIAFLSNNSSSSKSLITTDVGVRGENCL